MHLFLLMPRRPQRDNRARAPRLVPSPARAGRAATRALGAGLLLIGLGAPRALAQGQQGFTTSFEQGTSAPAGWSLPDGKGALEPGGHSGRRCLGLRGEGKGAQFWKCDTWSPRPAQLYRLTFWAKAPDAAGGLVISGPNSVNHDFARTSDWQRCSCVFITPRSTEGSFLRLGQWEAKGRTLLDDVRVAPVVALHRRANGMELGDGERIERGRYLFEAPLDGAGSNYSRPLAENTAAFNTNRWVMTDGATVTYRHRVGTLTQRAASVSADVGYYVRGRLVIEASRDGKNWQPVGALAERGKKEFALPASLFPAQEVWVRLRGEGGERTREDSGAGEFQVHGYGYTADLEGAPADATGQSTYLEIESESGPARVAVESLGGLRPGLDPVARARVANPGATPLKVAGVLTFSAADGRKTSFRGMATVPARGETPLAIRYALPGAGAWTARLSVSAGGRPAFSAAAETFVPTLYASGYGYLVSSDPTAALWWAEGTYKISREREAPSARRPVVSLSAARHEYEPVQVVVRPARALKGVTAQIDDFAGPGGARIARGNATLRLVGYVDVQHPTDRTGVAGAWPDPLPPCDGPFDVAAGANQPIWVTVYVPQDAAPGDYSSRLRLRAGSWAQSVPIRLHVWNFTLPQQTHIRSAFGFSPSAIRRYQNLPGDREFAQAIDLYLRDFSAHRLSPYDPTPLAPIQVAFGESAWSGGRQVADPPFEGARCLQVVDDSAKGTAQAEYAARVPVDPAKEYQLAWAARTAVEGQQYQVTLNCYDAQGQWLSGRNIDQRVEGTRAWKREQLSLRGRLPAEARAVAVILRPAPWSDAGSAMGTAWFDAVSLRQAPDGPELLKDGGFETSLDPAGIKVDFTRFDAAAQRAFNELHFNTIRLHLEGLGGGTFQARNLGKIGGTVQGTPEYEALFKAYARQIQDHLEAKGWLDKAYVYWFDEPEPRDYDFVKEGMALLKRAAPKLPRLLTEQVEPELTGSVDIWCPITNAYGAQPAHARQAAGEHVWWYVCTGPKAPYCTLFIDHPAIEMRMWLWQTWKYGVEGILVWESNYWTSPTHTPPPALQNPWADPMSYVSGYAGATGMWGNGDGRFLYPPNRDPNNDKAKHLAGPVDSLRWEMLREGLEDTEYFFALRDAIAKARARGVPAARLAAAGKLLEVPAAICQDMTHFTTDPQPLYARREQIARAIEGLRR